MKIKNKIGYCDNKYLKGIKDSKSKGHYVYIRSVNKDGTCVVNTITSLEKENGDLNLRRIEHLKKGNIYAIPKYDSNFSRWSGVTRKPIKGVKVKNIEDIGKKKIKRRHFFFIGKFFK